ncbi:nose resistant to fluoxetine protein 6-like [Cloeon dipterum]|uniref:nose resistant to fluoxetine protein 6-like n=1 Tax=Cloeon dipterum TaxID=197152 RepID=UPI00321F75D0
MDFRTAVLLCLMLSSFAKADCDADLEEYFQGLNPSNPQLWSLEMLDSSAKFMTDGISELTLLYKFANFDQCIAVNGPSGLNGNPKFTGQYCLFAVGLQLPSNNVDLANAVEMQQNLKQITKLRVGEAKTASEPLVLPSMWGVCAPSSCGLEGVKRVADFNTQLFANVLGLKANTTMYENSCYYEGSFVLDAAAWCFIAFAILLACLILASTVLEIFYPKLGFAGQQPFFNAFSLNQTLMKDLMRLPEVNAPGHLRCLHGMRTMSMVWVVLCHSYSIVTNYAGHNLASTLSKFPSQWFIAPLLNGYMSVDTFLLLSGLLTVYIPLMDDSKGRKFNVLKYYIYRYLRITIPLAVAIWFVSTTSIYFGKGPTWTLGFRTSMQVCRENWWANILYISNYFFDFCMGHTWYLCVDMQLALLAPLIIYPLIKWPKYGLVAIFVLTLGSIAAVFAVTYTEDLPWTSQFNVDASKSQRYLEIIYINTPMRASPYLIGMALGYVLSKKYHVSIPKWGVALGWLASTALALSVIFLILIPYSEGYVENALEAAFFSSLHKPAWALSLCWIIWACVNGYGGFIDKILSWKYFIPLSKLTFCGYLMHASAITLHSNLRRTPYFISHFQNLYLFSGILILTLPYTIVLYLAVEAPTMNLMRLAFKKRNNVTEPVSRQINKSLGKEA